MFTSEPAYLPLFGWFLHAITGAPYVLVLYDLYPDVAIALGVLKPGHPLARLWQAWQGRALTAAREVVVLSSTMAARLQQVYPELTTAVSVIPSWADPRRIRPLPKEHNPFVRRHGLNGLFTVLYAGNQGRCHDLDTLLDAAVLLAGQPGIRFVIVGDGARHRQLLHALTQLAVVSLLAAAEGQVAPSKLYGHLAAATPVAAICGSDSYLVDELKAGGCGAAFRSGDGAGLAAFILRLVAQPQTARQLGLASRRHLLNTATPELVLRRYGEVLARHLPQGRLVAQPSVAGA